MPLALHRSNSFVVKQAFSHGVSIGRSVTNNLSNLADLSNPSNDFQHIGQLRPRPVASPGVPGSLWSRVCRQEAGPSYLYGMAARGRAGPGPDLAHLPAAGNRARPDLSRPDGRQPARLL